MADPACAVPCVWFAIGSIKDGNFVMLENSMVLVADNDILYYNCNKVF